MKSGIFQEMIQRYLQGTATRDEVKFLEQYYTCYDDVNDPEISETELEVIKNRIKERLDISISQLGSLKRR
jgi:hypothetical protein